jgi:hypothetical protein
MPQINASPAALAVNPGLNALDDLSLARLARWIHGNTPLVPVRESVSEGWDAVVTSAALAFLVGSTICSKADDLSVRALGPEPRTAVALVMGTPLPDFSRLVPPIPEGASGVPTVTVVQSKEEEEAASWMDLADAELGGAVRGFALQMGASEDFSPYYSSLTLLGKYFLKPDTELVSFTLPGGTLSLRGKALPEIRIRIESAKTRKNPLRLPSAESQDGGEERVL